MMIKQINKQFFIVPIIFALVSLACSVDYTPATLTPPISTTAAPVTQPLPYSTIPPFGIPITIVVGNTPAPTSPYFPIPQATVTFSTYGGYLGSCTTVNGWIPYTVSAGDTLSYLAQQSGTTIDNLVSSNCLSNADSLSVGQIIYLPHSLAVTSISSQPTIQGIQIEPSTGQGGNGSAIFVRAGTIVTVRAQGVANATTVTFYLQPTGAGTSGTPIVLGVDNNLADGATAMWAVPTGGAVVRIWATADNGSGATVQSTPVLVYATQN